MAKPFLSDAAQQALSRAVLAVEAASSAELVIAVRPAAASYFAADLLAGAAAAFAALAVLLYSRWTFGLHWFLLDPLVVGALAVWAASRSPALRRALTPAAERRRRVETAARALFVERRVHRTSGRTGILLYIALLEREAALVVDLGVEPVAATAGWRAAVAALAEAVRRGEDGTAVAARVEALAGVLAPVLVHAADDVNELEDTLDEARR